MITYFIILSIIILNNIVGINSIVDYNGIKYNINTNYILPNTFLLGPMKSGSSSLYIHSRLHDEVCGGVDKEINFLQNQKLKKINANTRLSYSKKFIYQGKYRDKKCTVNGTKKTIKLIDASPQFHMLQKILPMFPLLYTKKELNELKFIITLREPVSRSYSYYSHFTREALSNNLPFVKVKSFETRTKENQNSILIYLTQLVEFVKYFRRDQILILADTYLYTNTVSAMKDISKFLNISFTEKWEVKSLPREEHLMHPRFYIVKKCCIKFVPLLSCSFRDELGEYYEGKNKLLYKWMSDTKINASKYEPNFPPFKSYKNINCTINSEKQYALLLQKYNEKNLTSCELTDKIKGKIKIRKNITSLLK